MNSNIHPVEQEILQCFDRQDNKAITLIFHKYGKALYGIIYKIVQNKEDTEEVLQDVLVKIWEKFDMYDRSKGKLYTWMLNISRNTAIDKVRSKHFKQNSKTDSTENSVNIEKADNGVKPELIGVQDLTNKLEGEQKKVIDLAYFKGYTQKEISKELNMPLGTVKTKVRSALTFLKGYLKNEY